MIRFGLRVFGRKTTKVFVSLLEDRAGMPHASWKHLLLFGRFYSTIKRGIHECHIDKGQTGHWYCVNLLKRKLLFQNPFPYMVLN